MADKIRYDTVTIAAGASLSGALTIPAGYTPVAYITASTWDTNATSFQACADGTNYWNLYDGATELSHAGVVASTYHSLDADKFLGCRKIKVRSGTAAAAVNQADATIVTVVMYGVGA